MNHNHYVTVIETDAPDVYSGSRIAVFHNREEAEQDMIDWITEYAEDDPEFDGHLDTADKAMEKYMEYTGRQAKIEDCPMSC